MENNLRKNGMQTCEDRNAFFARLESEILSVDFQLFTAYITFDMLHIFE